MCTKDRMLGALIGIVFFPIISCLILVLLIKLHILVWDISGIQTEIPLYAAVLLVVSSPLGGLLGLLLGIDKMQNILTRRDYSGTNKEVTPNQEAIIKTEKSILKAKQ